MYHTFNQWNTASFLYSQIKEEDRLEYKLSLAIVRFIQNKFWHKKKHA